MRDFLFNKKPILAAITLCFLSPIIAEYLLGIWSFKQLSSLLFLVPFYGCGALIIREAARNFKVGWVGIFCYSIAFGLVEEGLLTLSLFNPNYYHADLLTFGYLESINSSPFWIIYVLGLHSLGSICLPILLIEMNLNNTERTSPWLKGKVLFICCVAYIASATSIYIGTQQAFPFKSPLFATLAILTSIFVFITLPLQLKRIVFRVKSVSPEPKYVFLSMIALGAVFFGQHYYKESFGFSQHIVAFSMFCSYIISVVLIWYWSHTKNWCDAHYLVLAIALLTIYSILGVYQYSKHTTALGFPITSIDIILHALLIASLLLPLVFKVLRSKGTTTLVRNM